MTTPSTHGTTITQPTPTTIQDLRSMGLTVNDPSSINDFITCPRYYFHRHIEGLIPVDAGDSFKLDFGIALHLALAHYFKSGRTPDAQVKSLDIFKASFTGKEEREKITKAGRTLLPIYTIQFGMSLLTYYFLHYSTDLRSTVEVEIPLMDEIRDGMFLVGVIDLILEDRGTYIINDHKSTGNPERFCLNPNLQFMTYNYLVSKFTGLPQTMITGEVDFLIISKTKDPSEMLSRPPYSYSTDQLTDWESSTVKWLNLITTCRLECDWPQSWYCKRFFKTCSYNPLCSSVTRRGAEALKQTAYKVEFWNPLAIGE